MNKILHILLVFYFSLTIISCGSDDGGSSGSDSSSNATDSETGDTGTADGGTTDGDPCSPSSSCDIGDFDHVDGADPQSIRICPSSPIILNSYTNKFTLIGTYENNCRLDLTSFAWWDSDNSSFVNVNGGATFTATVDKGSFNVTVTYGTRNTTTQVRLSTVPQFRSIRPYPFSTVNTSAVGYTLSEALASGTVTYTRTGGTADGNVHTVNLAGFELLPVTRSYAVLTNAPTLVDGSIYTIAFNGTDLGGNSATEDSVTGVTYDTTAADNTNGDGGTETDKSIISLTIDNTSIIDRVGKMKQLTATVTYTDGSIQNSTGSWDNRTRALWYTSYPSAATVTDETGSDRGGILTIKSTEVAIITAAYENYGDTSYVRGREIIPVLATQVAAGESHSCALLENASVKCWGRNNYGQLGDDSTTNRTTAVSVSGSDNFVDLSVGDGNTCGVLSSGGVKCWGRNDYGQLGDNSTDRSLTPVTVTGLSGAQKIAAGNGHNCTVLSGGIVKCWGGNKYGQLGSTDTFDRLTPVQAGE